MSIPDLENAVAKARERLALAVKALGPKHKGAEIEAYEAARAALLSAEREFSAAKGEQYAIPLDFPIKLYASAPSPYLYANHLRAYLAFRVAEPALNSGAREVGTGDPPGKRTELLALVDFARCLCAKLGSPNDEVFEGHPLSGHGLDGYTAQVVKNSWWLKEIETINKVHRLYNPENWKQYNHYVFWFPDTTVECIATSCTVETFRENMHDMFARIAERMTG